MYLSVEMYTQDLVLLLMQSQQEKKQVCPCIVSYIRDTA